MTVNVREQVYGFVCRFIDEHGYAPPVGEIGAEFGISHVGAWKHVKLLIEEGRLRRNGGRQLRIVGRVDLRPVPTDRLQAELARRRAVEHAGATR